MRHPQIMDDPELDYAGSRNVLDAGYRVDPVLFLKVIRKMLPLDSKIAKLSPDGEQGIIMQILIWAEQ